MIIVIMIASFTIGTLLFIAEILIDIKLLLDKVDNFIKTKT